MTEDKRRLTKIASQHSPQAALELADALQNAEVESGGQFVPAHMDPDRSGIDNQEMCEEFMNYGILQEVTAYFLDNLKSDHLENGEWQIKVIPATLMNAPHVADLSTQQDIWNQYDKQK